MSQVLCQRIWHRSFAVHGGDRSEILNALAERGIEPIPYASRDSATPGLIICDTLTQDVLECINADGTHQLTRLLVVSLNSGTMTPNNDWAALAAGASDVLGMRDPAVTAQAIIDRLTRWATIDRVVDSDVVRTNLVGRSPKWVSVLRQVAEASMFSSHNMLIVGETGTGKELVAQLIHTLDPQRSKHPLVILDSTTLSPELSGSELFGHERGAFTGAQFARDGALAIANRGTLFVDEVGELTLGLQAQLLRAIQERTFKRVGGNRWTHSDFRLICATNRDLTEEVKAARFRSDLYYRIAAITISLPSLRERAEDIPDLANYFARLQNGDGIPVSFHPTVQQFLLSRDYPGNVRELQQLVARIMSRHEGSSPITVGAVPLEERPMEQIAGNDFWGQRFQSLIRHAVLSGMCLKDIGRAATDAAIRVALEEEGENVKRAALRLGVTDRALQMRRATPRTQDQRFPRISHS